ncbi:GNAT family N-acetyltransferase [Clostridium sp.]|uniref:GNAT family N-acetyltransferase n=2 Tax=unclassified Clostridium TaxID=2614128 RepID=UPI003216735F
MMIYKELKITDLVPELLKDFDRHEKIYRAWRLREDGSEYLKDIYYEENWDNNDLLSICNELKSTLEKGGSVFAAFDESKLVGFASLENEFFGSKNQYIQLSNLHITNNYRHKGIGKTLFNMCTHKARELKARKIYISASSCENAQNFYRGIDCVLTKEVNKKLYNLEPFDCHMEYIL